MPGRQVVIIGEVYDPTLSAGMPLPPGGGSGSPPGIWGGLPWPTPPIYYPPPVHPAHPIVPPGGYPPSGGGGNPPGIWGGGPHPAPPIYYPGQPPAGGGSPPGIWGGPPAYVDIGGPLPQPIPGWPPVAMPPIYYPPDSEQPPSGGNGEHPAHPIVVPDPPNPAMGHILMQVTVYVPEIEKTKSVWLYVEVPPPPTTPEPKPKG